jgi:WS/DGAT/MGAT family acyltransferase
MFLLCERGDVHMHVAATLIFDGAPNVERIVRYIDSRLALVPRYRQRLRWAPFGGNPVWVDDDRFDVGFHVRGVAAPAPGDDAALKRLVGHIISTPLDRTRPLWRVWVVTGLQGNRFALVSKMHHCMVDGIAGADLLAVMLTPHPTHSFDDARAFVPRRAPSPWELLRDAAWERLRQPAAVATTMMRLATGDDARRWLAVAQGLWETVAAAAWPAPASPLNRPITRYRRFDWTALPLDDVQAIRSRLGGTINDVALATVAGALRRFLVARHPDEDLADLRIMVPVSTRDRSAPQTLGNQVSGWLMMLPVREADPVRRYGRVRAATASLKASRQHLGGQLLTSAGSTLLSVGLRLVERLRAFNLLVTNVPGPRETLYLLNGRLRYVYPEAPLFPNQGLGIALFSYAGTLCVGFHVDCHVVPDTERLVTATRDAFAELLDVAAAHTPPDAASWAAAAAG